jgi:hypothetical protein
MLIAYACAVVIALAEVTWMARQYHRSVLGSPGNAIVT